MSSNENAEQDVSRYHVPNLLRALDVFELLSKFSEGLTQTEISDTLKVPRNSIFRITMTLEKRGYLYRDEISKKFILTPKLLKVGFSAVGEINLIEKSMDVMKSLRDEIDETVLLGTFMHDEGMVLEAITGGGLPFKLSVDPGMRFKLYCSAPGKAYINALPEVEKKALLKRLKFGSHTSNTISSSSALIKHLDEWSDRGYFVDDEEEFHGLRCVGAVIRNRQGHPISAIWTAGPIDRFPIERLYQVGEIIKSKAAVISKRLGYL